MRNFKSYTIDQFESFIKNLTLNRKITHIQIHHTWRPRKTDYKGESTIYGMWRYHTQTKGWIDIAQHFSVAPDGTIWDGRSLEYDPAGISGHNKGGIMFEIIGDFDEGQETLEGRQLYSITRAVWLLLKKFNLSYDDIVFHREFAPKTCPGSSIKKEWFITMVQHAGDTNTVSEWAKGAQKWAKENHISDGTRPKDTLTREEAWAMFQKFYEFLKTTQ